MNSEITENTGFNPFGGNPIEKAISTTEAQREILASCIIGGSSANLAYNESVSIVLTGAVKADVLEKAAQELVARNEALRSSFNAEGTQMLIYFSQQLLFSYNDLSTEDPERADELISDFVAADASAIFDLFNGPLIRFALFKKSENRYILIITAHHVVCDGWSFGTLLEEISGIYNALLNKSELPLRPLLYSDYVQKTSAFTYTKAYELIQNYWLTAYRNNIPAFEIQPDFPRPKQRTYNADRYDYTLPDDVASLAKKTGAKYGGSWVNTMMTIFEILLYKYTGNNDIVIGLAAAGQPFAEMYKLIGHCVHTLPLRSQPQDGYTFAEYLKTRKSKILEDLENQQFTFGSLLEKLNVRRDPSRIPLMPLCFNIDIGMDRNVRFQEAAHEIVYNPRNFETFEIFLNITENKRGYDFQWSYNKQLYSLDTIKGLMQKFTYLLEQVVADPEQKIEELKLEPKQVLATEREQEKYAYGEFSARTIVDILTDRVRERPANIAVVSGNKTVTYQELDERSNRLAHYLISRGAKKEDLVGLCIERHIDMIVAIIGIIKCGAAYVPIAPDYPRDRIAYILKDCGAKILVSTVNLQHLVEGFDSVQTIYADEPTGILTGLPSVRPGVSIKPDNILYVIYTSGSTGNPKGVLIEHRNVVRLFFNDTPLFDFKETDVWCMFHSFNFDFSVWEMFGALLFGGKLVMVPADYTRDAALFYNLIKKERLTVLNQTPSFFNVLQETALEKEALKTIRYVIFGGEALYPSMLKKWSDVYTWCKLINMYGITETTVHVTYKEITAKEIHSNISNIGKPIPTLQCLILDDHFQPVPVGVTGELFVTGEGVARGYLNRPELTEERFMINPFRKNERMYRSGDLARWLPDGNIEYLGRRDLQVKIRGFRIELGEIESRILEIKEVRAAVVLAKDSEKIGQYLVAYVIPENEQILPDREGWQSILGKSLPGYMVPGFYVTMERFPLTANGKIDRNAFPEPHEPSSRQHEYQAPESQVEKKLVQVWSELLGVEKVGINDDFFELGGHSMVAIKVMNRINSEMNIKLPIASLFQYPTIASFANLLKDKSLFEYKILVEIKKSGTKPPIYLIHGGALNILLYKNLKPFLSNNQPLYGIQALGLDGDLRHLDHIESIASRYLDEILRQNPDGPYILIGYSYSGVVVYEMARQLLAAGKKIKMIGILDTNVSNRDLPDGVVDRMLFKIKRQIKKGIFIGSNLFRDPAKVIRYQWALLTKQFNKNEEELIYDYGGEVVEAYDRAYKTYKMVPSSAIKVHLFRVKERIYFIDDFKYLGWKRYAIGGVTVHEIDGDHKTFLLPPHNKKLIEEIEKTLSNMNPL
ncbi:amino acid adenylation domain-containing protein [Niabella yanshanensis]|uniref:Amino acid adenylation domain-containing protein n=1 Tax=Niabella yanshanensis TaxID=577386 RepID=A0ABZ0WCP1_9BACT|nr:non-ribosomal peptide synthetase [Niabella yanshanensis]WQD39662.1 amino acid adenylation domain-containing protein [Niabella yanshanensis]